KAGCIINIASAVGLKGMAGSSVYAASKAGVIGFSRSLSKELGPFDIRVNSISPGFIETDMTSGISSETKREVINATTLRRFGSPKKDIAYAVAFLSQAEFITGQCLEVDGGLNI
ncbi:hypothetical protein HK096_006379, partial [Nowakowskiella sp. JEL0078]